MTSSMFYGGIKGRIRGAVNHLLMIKFTKTSVTIIDMKLRQHPRKEYEV